jgi:hypothetical protein
MVEEMKARRRLLVTCDALPLLIILGLMIPGDQWIAGEARTLCALIAVLILPGYALARSFQLFDHLDCWLDALSLTAALTWVLGLVPWLLFFFLGVSLRVVSLGWLGLTAVGLVASYTIPRGREGHPTKNERVRVILTLGWILILTGAAFVYGGELKGDAYSYMTWLRNVRVGDTQPAANIHASWEASHPMFKGLYAPTHLHYAMASLLARVDTNWVWSRAPAAWVPVMLAVQFSLAREIFGRRVVGYAALALVPLLLSSPTSHLGDPHQLCNFVLLPLAFWLYLRALFHDRQALWWSFPLAALVVTSLTFEHIPHLIHFLLVVGSFTALHLLSREWRPSWRSLLLILLVLVLASPIIWDTWQRASDRQWTAGDDTERIQQEQDVFLGSERFFIVRPVRLLSGQTSPMLALLGAILSMRYAWLLWHRKRARLITASVAIVAFVGLNPLLTPLISRTIAPQTTKRLGEALITFPVLAYAVTRTALRARAAWTRRRKEWLRPSLLLAAFLCLAGYGLAQTSLKAINGKVRNVVYAPAGVNPNLSDRLIRRVFERELKSPPYPILHPPAQLTRYLDASTLRYIEEEIPSDSVFLSERLTESNLPAYVDQLTYLGRKGWPGWGDVCPEVRATGAGAAFPTIPWPEVRQRLDVACALLDRDADPRHIEELLAANDSEIDYVLVTPNTSYLRAKLDQIIPQAQIYDNDSFAIYSVDMQR